MPACADVFDLQRGELGGYPSSLCSPELRQPWSCSAQSVCCRRQTLLRGEALAQELPLWSLWLVCNTFYCQSCPFVFFVFAVVLLVYFGLSIFCFVLLSFPFLLPPFLLTLNCIVILLLFWCCNYIVIVFLLTDRETIFFNSQQVSKPESSSDLTAVSSTRGIMHLHYKLVKFTRHGLLCISKKNIPRNTPF